MKTEFSQDDADLLTSDHCAALGELVESFMRETGLRFGYTLLTFDRSGIKTMGNMPMHAQLEMFAFVAGQLANDGPQDVETISLDADHKH